MTSLNETVIMDTKLHHIKPVTLCNHHAMTNDPLVEMPSIL